MVDTSKLLLSRIPKVYQLEISEPESTTQVRLVDFELGEMNVDYPQVQNFLFRPVLPAQHELPWEESADTRGAVSMYALPWGAVQRVDWRQGTLLVKRPELIQAMDDEAYDQAVLLVRDIQDAYIIDLENRRLTRANDLLLEQGPDLRLVAVDTGIRAVLRRLSRGLYQGFRENELKDWQYFEFLRGDPGAVPAGARYHRRIAHLPPGEIAFFGGSLPYLHAAELMMLLPPQLAADTLELLSSERQLQVFEEINQPFALSVLEKMAPDIAADLIGRLDPEQARHYLNQLPKVNSDRIVDLLRYPENTVGGIMTNDMIAIPGELTIAQARERLRTRIGEPDFIYFLYVIDSDEGMQLRGVVTLRSILIARDDQQLEEIMNPYLETLNPLDSPQQAAYFLLKSQLAALPVAAPDGRLLGVVTVDAAVRLVAPASWSSQAPRIFS